MIGYLLKEAFDGFKRAKLSSLFSVMTVAFLLILIGLFSLLAQNVDRFIHLLRAEYDIQVYIANYLNDQEIEALRVELTAMPEINRIEFYSKEAAAREFRQQFGEQVFEILEENPLPSTFNMELNPQFRQSGDIQALVHELSEWPGVEEVVHQSQALHQLASFSSKAGWVNIFLAIFVIIGSLLVMFHSIRLAIFARRHIISTMELVGATRSFIRWPYLIEGLVQGFVGGILASIVMYGVMAFVNVQAPNLIHATFFEYGLIIGLGTLLGFFASLLAVRRFLND
ncbi:FtsX-like permease family protein [candidate division KSB1 bacterium]|jgi:cell division transport system permease protein|nr:FtsX-like permease family protein [candidate division KSB1 bacterium]